MEIVLSARPVTIYSCLSLIGVQWYPAMSHSGGLLLGFSKAQNIYSAQHTLISFHVITFSPSSIFKLKTMQKLCSYCLQVPLYELVDM